MSRNQRKTEIYRKINETKVDSFKTSTEMDKPLAKLRKRTDNTAADIRNERRVITADPMDINRVIRNIMNPQI